MEKTVVTDRRGNVTEYAYSRAGAPLSRTELGYGSGTLATSWAYGADGRVASETRPDGSSTLYSYDRDGNVSEERLRSSDPADADVVVRYGWDSEGRLAEKTAPDGSRTLYSYDASGRPTSVVAAAVRLSATGSADLGTSFSYSGGYLSAKTLPDGSRTEYSYSGGLLAEVTDSLGTLRYAYDAAGNPTAVTDAEGNVTRSEFDAFGRVVKTVSPEGLETRYSYDANDNRIRTERSAGPGKTAATRAAFGLLDEVLSEESDLSETLTGALETRYDANGEVAERLLPSGVREKFLRDPAGRVTERRLVPADASEDAVARYSYSGGLLAEETDPLGRKTEYRYDGFGRLSAEISPLGTETRYSYGPSGKPVRTDVLDASGALVARSESEYGSGGLLLVVRSAAVENGAPAGGALETRYSYGPLGRKTEETAPGGGKTRYAYSGSLLASVTDAT